jgi:hypothetical protein
MDANGSYPFSIQGKKRQEAVSPDSLEDHGGQSMLAMRWIGQS